MTGWVGKGGGAATPGTIDRAVHQVHTALPEPRARLIDIADSNGHEHARSGARSSRHHRLHELQCLRLLYQIEHYATEPDHAAYCVGIDRLGVEHGLVEC